MTDIATYQGHNVLFLPVAAPAVAADTQIIPADTGIAGERGPRRIRIFSLVLVSKAVTNVTLKSGAVAISGVIPMAANQTIPVTGEPSSPFLELAAGAAFNINTSADGVYGWVGFTLDLR